MTQYDLKNTHLSFLEEDCTAQFGADHCDFHLINNK